jgi:choline dehydrogenase-like flavoprotein
VTRISNVRPYHVAYPLDRPLSDSSPDLRVHDTPWLYVFSGAVFPTCPGVNPTLTMWAVCYRAAERLVERLSRGEEQLLDRR